MLTTACLRICSTLVGVHEVMTMANSISLWRMHGVDNITLFEPKYVQCKDIDR
jgi:hypothetical protein